MPGVSPAPAPPAPPSTFGVIWGWIQPRHRPLLASTRSAPSPIAPTALPVGCGDPVIRQRDRWRIWGPAPPRRVPDTVRLLRRLFDPLRCLWPLAAPSSPSPYILPPHGKQHFGASAALLAKFLHAQAAPNHPRGCCRGGWGIRAGASRSRQRSAVDS